MTHVRQRLSVLALGVLLPVLALGAVALSSPSPAWAIDEEPYVADEWTNCQITWSGVWCPEGECWLFQNSTCDQGTTSWGTLLDMTEEEMNPDLWCTIGLDDFDYCKQG